MAKQGPNFILPVMVNFYFLEVFIWLIICYLVQPISKRGHNKSWHYSLMFQTYPLNKEWHLPDPGKAAVENTV